MPSTLNRGHFSQLIQNIKLFYFFSRQNGNFYSLHLKKMIYDYLLIDSVKTYQSIYCIQSFI